MKQKLLSLLFVGLLVLSGCSGKDSGGSNDDNTITVGLECNYAPFNWTQLDDSNGAVKIGNTEGYCAGYDVEIAKLIADALDKELVIKKVADFDSLPTEATTNEIDLIIAGMSPTEERSQVIAFSDPYYYSDLVLVVRADGNYANATNIQDFSGAKVSAQRGTMHDGMIDQINDVNHGVPLSDFPTLTVAVKSNDIDAFVSERPVAIAITANNPELTYIAFDGDNGFELTDEDENDLAVSVGLRKDDTETLTKVNELLTSLSTDDRNDLMTKAISNQPEAEEE